MTVDVERRLLGLVAVGDKAGQEVDEEVARAAVPGVFDRADVLELVVDALDDRSLAQQQRLGEGEQAVAQVLAQLGDEANATLNQELFGEQLGDVAAVAEKAAEDAPDQARHRAAVVAMAGRQAAGQQLAAVVDDQVQLAAGAPAHRGLAPARIGPEDLVLRDPGVTAGDERGGVHEAAARTRSQLGVQLDGQREQHARHACDEAGVADQVGELGAQVDRDVLGVEALERARA